MLCCGPSQIQLPVGVSKLSKSRRSLHSTSGANRVDIVPDPRTMYIGILDGEPRIVVDQSTFVISRRIRGLNQILRSQNVSTRNSLRGTKDANLIRTGGRQRDSRDA